jgi:hypothetical protein
MTLVIGLLAKDGCLLAADTKVNGTKQSKGSHNGEPLLPVRYTTSRSKIRVSGKHGIIIGWAGSDVAETAADSLKTYCESAPSLPDDLSPDICAACESACSSPLHATSPHFGAQLLIANSRSEFMPLWSVTFSRHLNAPGQLQGTFYCKPRFSFGKEVIGEDASSALFFLERYYTPRTFSINELLLLAGHVIRTASDLAKDWVDGLEIAICTPKGNPEYVQLKTLKAIASKSDQLSDTIERTLRRQPSKVRRSQRRAML